MATPADLVASALQRWRNNLIDLTRRNPLLSLKPNRTSFLDIVQPDLLKVYEQLFVAGKTWVFYLPAETPKAGKTNDAKKEPRANELLTTETDRATLVKI